MPMAVPLPATGNESGSEFRLRPKEAQELLRGCFGQYRAKLVGLARTSLEMSADLFEGNTFVTDTDVQDFRLKRPDWVARFERTIVDLFEKRIAGAKRKGRRPDYDASLASLRVLTAFDHEKQAALTAATSFLLRLTRRELDALDLRTEVLLPETGPRDTDNPFAPAYILDAIGSTSRAVYPNSRVWRPLMERMLTDLTPTINKIYITLNRYLADHHVLPEIKAALRIRSEHRPEDDRELLPAFSKLFAEAGDQLPANVVVPETLVDPNAAPAFNFDHAIAGAASPAPSAPPAATMASPAILAGLEALARLATPRPVPGAAAAGAPGEFPDLDPLMALGTSTPLFATLGQWQRVDLRTALADAAPQPDGGEVAMVPLNLIPHIRTAIAGQIENPTDRITVDVIALLFDYIFRDPSIPDSLRNLFGRLQVPIVKAALLDRTFFSDKRHPARLLLDHLADAAVGAQNDEGYRAGLELMATGVIDDLSRNFEIDVSIFRGADDTLTAFIESERRKTAEEMRDDVAAALEAEEGEADRSAVRAMIRDKLAGLDLPFDVRSFAETTWADYMASVRKAHGEESNEWNAALGTLDDLLWSIVVKERTAQKARLTKMIPTLIGGLRKGIAAQQVPADRATRFFDEIYKLHMAAIKPKPEPSPTDAPAEEAPPPAKRARAATNVHDFVSEMPAGTWLAFRQGDDTINARLTWVSPLRTKYIFTSRARHKTFVFSPEELAYELGSGKAALVVEPVPLFDRAVSAALDSLAASKPKDGAAAEPVPAT